jgi:hypothetical protein
MRGEAPSSRPRTRNAGQYVVVRHLGAPDEAEHRDSGHDVPLTYLSA